MRTSGPSEQVLRLVDPSAGRSDGLQAGAVVFVTVRERLGTELYRITLGRLTLAASSSVQLEPGAVLKARVERGAEGLVLRLERNQLRGSPGGMASALAAAGIPDDAAGRAALSALLGAGIAPEQRAIARVRRAALREGEGEGRTELAARMEAKGIPAEDEALDALARLADGRGGGADDGADGGGDRGRRRAAGLPIRPEAPPEGEAFDLSRDFGLDLPADELPKALADFLRSLICRAAGDGDSLALFNHLRGPEGGWVLIPFRFSLDEVDFAGSFRLQLPYIRGGQGRFEAVFSASRGTRSEDWAFSVDYGGGRGASIRITPPEARQAAAISRRGSLEEGLAACGCSLRLSARRGAEGPDPTVDFDA